MFKAVYAYRVVVSEWRDRPLLLRSSEAARERRSSRPAPARIRPVARARSPYPARLDHVVQSPVCRRGKGEADEGRTDPAGSYEAVLRVYRCGQSLAGCRGAPEWRAMACGQRRGPPARARRADGAADAAGDRPGIDGGL